MNLRKEEKHKRRYWYLAGAVCLVAVFMVLLVYVCQKKESYLFIGDSYAAKLESAGYSKDNVVIYAVPGITAEQLDKERGNFPDMNPDKVVLMVGINSLAEMEEGVVEIEDEKKLIADLKELYNVPVYVQKVFPVGETLAEQRPNLSLERVAEYNRLLEIYCNETEDVFFFNPQKGFLDENGYLFHTEDDLHISDEYLELYYQNIRKAIR